MFGKEGLQGISPSLSALRRGEPARKRLLRSEEHSGLPQLGINGRLDSGAKPVARRLS